MLAVMLVSDLFILILVSDLFILFVEIYEFISEGFLFLLNTASDN